MGNGMQINLGRRYPTQFNLKVNAKATVAQHDKDDRNYLLGETVKTGKLGVANLLENQKGPEHQKDGKYTVKSGYRTLCNMQSTVPQWPWKILWKPKHQLR